MTTYEICRLIAEPFLPMLHWQVRRDLKKLVKLTPHQPVRLLDVGGRKSPYTVGLPVALTVSDIPRQSEVQESLHLGLNQRILDDLGTCPTVESATAEYRQAEDKVAQFVEERCERAASAESKASELFAAYKAWAESQNELALRQTRFGTRLSDMGFQKRSSNGIIYLGLRPAFSED